METIEAITITDAKYFADPILGDDVSITATFNGEEKLVPICVGNKDYDEIMRQVEAGTLTIAESE